MRSTLIVTFFLLLTFTVVIIAQKVKNKSESYADLLDVDLVDEAKFKQMNYYSLAEGKKDISLNSDALTVINQEDFIFQATRGELTDKNGMITTFSANSGKYLAKKKELFLEEDIEFNNKEANYSADSIQLRQMENLLNAQGEVRAELTDLKTKDKIIISSNKMVSELDKKIIHFTGQIQITFYIPEFC